MRYRKKKTVCFFSGDITRCGGTERVSTIIANGLNNTGRYRILFLSLVEQKEDPAFMILSEIRRYVLKRDRKWIQPGAGYLPLIPALRGFLKRHDVDIIVDIDLVLDVLSIPASLGMSVKVISWEHFNFCYEQQFWYRRIGVWISALFSDYIVTLTRRDQENYERYFHYRRKIDYIYNPIEIFHRDGNVSKERMLITVGSFNRRKGTDMIATIIPTVLKKNRDWKWYFLGDGEDRKILEETVHRHGLEEQLILIGNVSNVEDYLKRASICVMTSRLEGLPMCLLEAKSCQVPCVSFDIQTGPSEIIQDGVNGFLVPPFDLHQMIEKIEILIENETLWRQFSQNTAIGIEKFCLKSILEEWEKVLEGI